MIHNKITLEDLFNEISPEKPVNIPIRIMIRKKNQNELIQMNKPVLAKEFSEPRQIKSQEKNINLSEKSSNLNVKKNVFSLKIISYPDIIRKNKFERSLTVRSRVSTNSAGQHTSRTNEYINKSKTTKINLRNQEILKMLRRGAKKIEVTGKRIFA